MRLRVRTWNVAHGRTVPSSTEDRLEEMVRRVSADDPDVVCLQEVPLWAFKQLGSWSAMNVATAITRRASAGPLGHWITARAPRVFRSGLTGQGNAILVSKRHRMLGQQRRLVLNPPQMRMRAARDRGLGFGRLVHWSKEQRVCHLCTVEVGDESAVVANTHLTHFDAGLASLELERAAEFARAHAGGGAVILAGDLNLAPGQTDAFVDLASLGWSSPGAGIDHILGHGMVPETAPRVWTDDRRSDGHVLLSDHAPVEADMMCG